MEATDLSSAWKALSDPTRRQILDLLRDRPRTTGELSDCFATSRFAVMKHLAVLEKAELITVRRRGRSRWNHLNAIPLQRIYERWLRPYEAAWARSLLRLKRVVEHEGEPIMPQSNESPTALDSICIEQEIRIEATPDKVFAALTGDVGSWWGRPYIQDPDRVQSVYLEPHLGGRFLERWSESEGAIWGVVTNFKQNERLILQGSMAMPGAVHGVIRFDLEEVDGNTQLKLSHHAIGAVNEELRASYDHGWTDLLGSRLKRFVEKGEKLGLGHEPPME